LHRYSGKLRGLEAPLLRRLEGGVAEQRMAVDDPRGDHLATLGDRDLDLNGATCFCGFGYRRVSRLNFLGRAALHNASRNCYPLRIIRHFRRWFWFWRYGSRNRKSVSPAQLRGSASYSASRACWAHTGACATTRAPGFRRISSARINARDAQWG